MHQDDPDTQKQIIKHSEEVSLLADNNSMEDESTDSNPSPRKHDSKQNYLKRSWKRLRGHLFIIVISLLLIGGLVALSVYFACRSAIFLMAQMPSLIISDLRHPQTQTRGPSTICLTPSCVLAASEILENLSPNHHIIDPCSNFNRFVCEGFEEKHDLRADQGSIFTGTFMAESSQQILRHVLETPYEADHEIAAYGTADRDNLNKLQDAYESCVNEDRLKKTGSTPLLNILRKIESLYPINVSGTAASEDVFQQLATQQPLTSKNEPSENLTQTVTYLASIGVTSFIEVNVGVRALSILKSNILT